MASRETKKGGARKRTHSSPRDATMAPSPGPAAPPPASSPPAAPATPSATPSVPPPRPPGAAPFPSWYPEPGAGNLGSQHQPAYPWANYYSFLQQTHFPPPPQQLGENSHFVGLMNNINPPSPVPPPYHKRSQKVIDIDDVEASKSSVRKRFWTHDEEVKLASAWLNTSKDPIHGNDKKSESFWGQITAEFNKDLGPDRARDTNQLKVHWSRLSTQVNEFNGYWSSVCKMNKSGYSDDQLMDEAQERFKKKNGKPFALVHWWRILKNEPKWCTHVAQTERDKSKAVDVDVTAGNEPRPIGREAAKAEPQGKRKAEQVMDGVIILRENMSKISEITEERKKEREKLTETHLEISRNNLQAAKEKKEAKLLDLKAAKEQKEAKLFDAYNLLLVQNTSEMSEEAKASREKLMRLMVKKMLATDQA